MEVLFVDPFFWRKPLRDVADGGGVGEFGDEPGDGTGCQGDMVFPKPLSI
jgi:hypothetical protein